MLRRLLTIGLLLPLLSACLHETRSSAGPPVVVCGTTLWTGAMTPVVWPLENPGPSPAVGGAPAADQLPPPLGTGPESGEQYVRVSDSCKHGAVVVVTPAGDAHLRIVARASDHQLVALVLDLTRPVTVQAWRDGVFAGSLRLPRS